MKQVLGKEDRGDFVVQYWFHSNTYPDPEIEKAYTYELWSTYLQPKIVKVHRNASISLNIRFQTASEKEAARQEKAIFRLVNLGVVEDYQKNWQTKHYKLTVRNIEPIVIREKLIRYIRKYKFEDYGDKIKHSIEGESTAEVLRACINHMVDFVYDEIAMKRKQAIATMAELCRDFQSSESFREAILAYLQESEYTSELKTWINRPFYTIGFENIYKLLDNLSTLEEAKRLVGTTRRMLDEDPANVALRYLSVCARVYSDAESDSSVKQEYSSLLRHIPSVPDEVLRVTIIVNMLKEFDNRRPHLSEDLLKETLYQSDDGVFAKIYLRSFQKWPEDAESSQILLGLLAELALVAIDSSKGFWDLKDRKFLEEKSTKGDQKHAT